MHARSKLTESSNVSFYI
jgi:hypothetical protein